MISCMGGWCEKREHCARHRYPNAGPPVERLCPKAAEPHYRPLLPAAAQARPEPAT